MRILQIVPYLKSGGVERGTLDFSRYLAREGHTPVVVSGGGPLVEELMASGVTHYALPVHRKSLLVALRSARELGRILEKERIDVVHARSRVPAWIAYLACRRMHIPLVTTCHGIYSTHGLSRVMGWGKKVIVISHAVSIHMKERFGVPFWRTALIHRGVNLSEFPLREERAPSGPRTVGIIGRITPIKGHPVLLRAMVRVLRVLPDSRLLIVGEADKSRYREELEMLCRRLGIGEKVEFLGLRHDVPELVRRMDLVVAPAVGEEAFGRVLIEAGASGVPVIASRIGGIVDIIEDGKDGILVPAGDVVSLADAIIDVLTDPESARLLAQALRRKVELLFNDTKMFERTVDVYREVMERKRILVIKLSALGDVILSVPSIRAIRERYPTGWITIVVERKFRDILKCCPYIDDVVSLEGVGAMPRWMRLFRLGRWLANEYFDTAVDLQNNRSSHLLAYLSGAYERLGYDNGKFSFLLNRRVKEDRRVLAPVEHQLKSLRHMGITGMDPRLELWPDPEAQTRMEAFLNEHWLGPDHTLVGINPGSSEKWPTKRWPLERIAWVMDELSKRNIRVILLGTPREIKIGEELSRRTSAKPIQAMGKTDVNELVALIRRCDVLLTSDSAPMHIASAIGTPFVAIFGPTDPQRHVQATYLHKVLYKKVSCSPCYLRVCPVGHICMKEISPPETLEAVLSLMEERAAIPRGS